jgi:maleylacetate reductase
MSRWDFTHTERPLRLIMGEDAHTRLADELTRLGATRALVVTTPGQGDLAALASDALGDRSAGVFDRARQQVPRETIDEARAELDACGADAVVTVGGGSAIGLGKALALEADAPLPLLVLPTTYAGSESTRIWGITTDGVKTTGRDDRVAPAVVAYVPSWTVGLPPAISAASGLNAMAHSVEALYAHDATPVTDALSVDSLRALGAALPRIMDDPGDLDARAEALYGAFLAGRALDLASLGLHHKICHVLGGSFGLPHAPTHAVVLPYATAYNAPAAPDAMAALAGALGVDDAVDGLWELARGLEIPGSLGELGLTQDDVGRAVELALQREYPNPRPIEADALTAMLRAAVRGDHPKSF